MQQQRSMIDTTTDGHVHTLYCQHASGEMEEYVLRAMDRGLKGLVFLEHLELGIRYFERTWLTEEDFAGYLGEGERLRRKYGNRIEIGLGVEVGYNPERVEDLRAFLARRTWDRVGISYHFVDMGLENHVNVVSRKQQNIEAMTRAGLAAVQQRYYQGLREAVLALPGTVLCHLDAGLRHHPELGSLPVPVLEIEAVLTAVAEKGMALEVNTSGFAMRGEPFPARRWLERASKLHIPLVASSDAHRPQDVGRYFDQLAGLAGAGEGIRPGKG